MPETLNLPEEALQAADVIEEALRLFGVEEPEDGATAVLGLLDERGMVVVSAEDLREYLFRGPNVLAAAKRLRAALPERTENA
ncbi:hypothetical protein AB0L65_32985 [Nonomuraea sp. NPDC052116]|uniref:hypothetical protein n=1 Tax=Nonomuraea sp. NPDC052116 TaxID=3155665 RepID=UPI003416DF52